jgi:uncharacterized protein (TIGR03067 family)
MKALLSAVLVVVAAGACYADDEAPKGDLGKLQGKWKGKIGPNKDMDITVEVKGKTVTATFKNDEDKEMTLTGEVKLDENAKPKTADFFNFKGADGNSLPDNLAIYELNGDEWKVSSGGGGNPRPTEFKDEDGGPHVMILKREKDAAKAADAAKPAAGDLAKLQGKWKSLVGPNKDVTIIIEFKDDAANLDVTLADGQTFALKGAVKLDEAAKPKTLTWIKFKSPSGDDVPDNLAIYELKDDELKTCSGGPGNPRPTEFKQGEGGPPNLSLFTRVKESPK